MEPEVTTTEEGVALPPLYSRTSKGAVQFWEISTEDSWMVSRFGLLDMKIQETRKQAKPKNVGRANETTPKDQAVLEAVSMWKKKVDKGYKLSAEAATSVEVILPMLAQSIDKHRKKLKYPCFVQPKLDGVRSLAYWVGDEVVLYSRGGKVYNVPHLSEPLKKLLPKDMVLDGEVYVHGESIQTLVSWVKKTREETELLQYHVYDCILLHDREADFTARNARLSNWFSENDPPDRYVYVKTETAPTESHVYALQEEWVGEGYEGAIARNAAGAYKLKSKSTNLLKVKSFQDDEYKVIGWESGDGRFSEFAVWECEMSPGGPTFTVMSKGTAEDRREMRQHADEYVGQWLKVKYFGFTDEGKPRFPVGLCFRPLEDM